MLFHYIFRTKRFISNSDPLNRNSMSSTTVNYTLYRYLSTTLLYSRYIIVSGPILIPYLVITFKLRTHNNIFLIIIKECAYFRFYILVHQDTDQDLSVTVTPCYSTLIWELMFVPLVKNDSIKRKCPSVAYSGFFK